jgi:hypothetical protein
MTNDQVNGLSGAQVLEDRRKQCWGDGTLNARFTNTEPSGKPALAKAYRCFDGPEFVEAFQAVGDPECDNFDVDIEGQSDGANSTIKFKYEIGSLVSASHSVSNAVEVAIGTSFEAQVGVPEVAQVKMTSTLDLKYNHEDNTATTEQTSEKHTIDLTYANAGDKTCKMTFRTDNCKQNARGNIRSKAGGFVWYNYEEWAENLQMGNPSCGEDGEAHLLWAAPLGWLDDEQRTVRTPVDSVIRKSMTAKYKVDCEGLPSMDFATVDPTQNAAVTLSAPAPAPIATAPINTELPAVPSSGAASPPSTSLA